MKKTLLIVAILVTSSAVFAQSEVKPNVIKVNPLGALFGSANVAYEKALNEKS